MSSKKAKLSQWWSQRPPVDRKFYTFLYHKKLWTLIGLVMIASLVLSACGTPTPETIVQTVVVKEPGTNTEKIIVVTTTPEPTKPVEKPQVLRVNLGTYPDTIDPQKSSFVNEIAHLKLIYEGLTALNEKLETVPGSAEKWEYNADATELIFTLRDGLQYSDGVILNAMRFKYSITRNINPETAGEYGGITDEIVGASEWRYGEGDAQTQGQATVDQSIQALDMAGNPCTDYNQADCRVLKIKLTRSAPYFHTVMGLWVAYPARQEFIEEGGDIWWNSSKYQVGNGPYALKSLEPFVRGMFVPNQNYWGGASKVDIEFSYITDSAISFQAYKNNEFDIIPLASEDLEAVQADPVLSKEAMIYAGNCTIALFFHNGKEPFNDPKVRQAFATAIDREAYVRDVLKGLALPTLTWIPKGFPGYQEGETRWAFDPEAAKKLMAESSYGAVDKLPKIVDTFGDTPRNRTRHEWLVAKFKQALGVDIELNPVETTTYTALTKDPATAPQMYLLGWCSDYPDPQNWLSVYFRSTAEHAKDIQYASAEFDKLVDEADSTIDPAKRMELYAQAQDLITNQSPVAFMYNTVNSYMVKPWVKGIKPTPQDAGWPGDVDPTAIDIDTSMLP